jgi:hypothetical protein
MKEGGHTYDWEKMVHDSGSREVYKPVGRFTLYIHFVHWSSLPHVCNRSYSPNEGSISLHFRWMFRRWDCILVEVTYAVIPGTAQYM